VMAKQAPRTTEDWGGCRQADSGAISSKITHRDYQELLTRHV
jgi:hypothetical protein